MSPICSLGPPAQVAPRRAVWAGRRPASAACRAHGAQHGVGQHVGGERTDERRVTRVRPLAPVASAKTTSPSLIVWIGRMLRARPSCAICATLVASALVRTAFGGDDGERRRRAGGMARLRAEPAARRGAAPPSCSRKRARRRRRGPGDDAARAGSTTSPIALTATSAATVMPPTSIEAVPRPPSSPARCRTACRPRRRRRRRRCLRRALRVEAAVARRVASGGIGADARVADPEVEQDRRRHDRHDEGRRPSASLRCADGDADAALLEPAHDAAGGIEPERAAAGEHDRVHLLDRVDRRRAARSRACPAPRRARRRRQTAPPRDHDRAAGRPPRRR